MDRIKINNNKITFERFPDEYCFQFNDEEFSIGNHKL